MVVYAFILVPPWEQAHRADSGESVYLFYARAAIACGRLSSQGCEGRRPTNRWTGAAVAYFSTRLVRRKLNEIAPPGQLNRWASNLSVMKFEILAGLPTSGDWPEQFSATGMGAHREGLVVKFYPDNQSTWVGNFQRGMTNVSDATEHPNGTNAIVVASGQGYVVDIDTRQLIECFGGIIDSMFRVPNQNVIIFGDCTTFLAYGPNGILWRSRRVSWDGVRSVTIKGDELVGEAWTPMGEAWKPFAVELTSGVVRGGSYDLPE